MTQRLLGVMVVLAASLAACKTNNINATTNNNTEVIGPMGGEVKGTDGEELLIPAGALMSSVTFSVGVAAAGSYPASPPAGMTFAGDVFEFTPHGTQFLTAATVIIPYTSAPTTPILLTAEEGGSTWTTLSITGTAASAEEGQVTTLSYFVVAESGGNSGPDSSSGGFDGSISACSGREPDAAATATTISSFTGTFTDTGPVEPALDLTTIVDGYATQSGSTLLLWFTPYTNACGYFQSNDSKTGAETLEIGVISGWNGQPGTFSGNPTGVQATLTPDAGCGGAGAALASSTTGPGITITAADAAHVAGNFNVTPMNSSSGAISGTFDVPFCVQGSQEPPCCF
jgi:hypothetical protein